MRILFLTLQGFKSYEKEVRVDFAGRKGLIYLTGENHAEPALGRNGTGKSTLFEGLFWMLYGKTSKNLKAGTIATWGSKVKCKGTLTFENNGHTYNLLRTWSPNKLFIETDRDGGRDIDQATLEELIGYGPDLFLHSIYHAQSAKMFMDLSPTEQLELFSSVLNLSVWEKASEQAVEQAREREGKVQAKQSALDRGIGTYFSLQTEIAGLEEDDHFWARERYHEAVGLLKDTYEAAAQLKLKKNKLARAKNGEADKLSNLIQQLATAKAEETTAFSEHQRLYQEEKVLSKELDAVLRQERAGEESICSKCGQVIPAKQVSAHLAREKDELHKKLAKVAEAKEKAAEALRKIEDQTYVWEAELKALKKAQEDSPYAELQRAVEDLASEISKAEGTLDSMIQCSSPVADKLPKRLRELQETKTQLEGLKREVSALRNEVEDYRYWVKGFKEVRLFLVEESLAQLEVETNACLYDLGLQEWSIEFAVEAETKSGGVKKGFTANIISPYNESPVPWEAWSGGEAQRLRLAMAMGMSSLIAAQTGIMSNIEIWDEPCQHLSEEGISGLLTALETRAEQTGRQVWIVEHQALDFGRFAETVKVIKTAKGSSLV